MFVRVPLSSAAPIVVCYHYIKIIVVCLSLMGGRQKQFDIETQEAVSLPLAIELEARTWQSLAVNGSHDTSCKHEH